MYYTDNNGNVDLGEFQAWGSVFSDTFGLIN